LSSANLEAKQELQSVAALTLKIETLESKVKSLTDAMDTARLEASSSQSRQTKATSVVPKSGAQSGIRVSSRTSPSDPEANFIDDDAIQNFRKAYILFQSLKYPDAVVSFSAFLENYPDHPLAGSAQYYIGESYFSQKEYQESIVEFNRVLTSYDHSPHLADTLRDLALAEEALQKTTEAARHRQLLTSLFPQSPAMIPKVAPPALPASSSTMTPTAPSTISGEPNLDAPPTPEASKKAP